ncbi:hypothetical protein [Helicobacter trogontum]|uniref:Uncharacterized protein n=2 Tax=Helicobacter trogontum TaxID=50960 RepID=A0A4U8S674_9HELI|nr:hypothetical protein [Helicobacter trogontum]TLD81335.1 hypothetical protein LS81_008470 [Helicobacter trogontum]
MSRESNNQENINPTMLKYNNEAKPTESIKRDSIKETSISTESNKLESKKPTDTKNKDSIKLDSNGDEIVYEIWHNPNWWDYFLMSVFFMFGVAVAYSGTEAFLLNKIENSLFVTSLVFGIPALLLSFYYLFYAHKNRFYITTQGIGFERRKWFRMQKRFYRFGEVGFQIILAPTGLCPITPVNRIIFFL